MHVVGRRRERKTHTGSRVRRRERDETGQRGRKGLELTGLKRGQTRSDDRMKMTSQLCGEQVRETSEEGLAVTWGEIR